MLATSKSSNGIAAASGADGGAPKGSHEAGLARRLIPRAPTAEEWMIGALFTLTLIASPLTGSARLAPKLVLGTAAGAVWMLIRIRRPASPKAPTTFAAPPVACVGVLAATLLAFAPTLAWLWTEYTDSIWRNPHGLFVILLMGLAIRSKLRRDRTPGAAGPEASPWGFVFLGAAALLLVVDTGVRSKILSVLALGLALPGLSLLLLGGRRTRLIAVPLAFAAFLLPFPERIGDPLGIARTTAEGTAWLLGVLDLPVLHYGTLFLVGNTPFEISQNCSGLTAVYGTFGFALLLACVTRSPWRRAALLLIPLPATIATNTLRCAFLLGSSMSLGTGLTESPLHGLSGIAVYVFVIAALWLTSDRERLREALA
jgi:exosortase